MSYDPTQLATSALYRVRFTLQDTDVTNEFLVDDELNYLLAKYSNDEALTTLDAAKRMLAQFAQYTREREGLIEVYGNEVFNQWKDYLTDLIAELNSGSSVAHMLIGGVEVTEVNRVKNDGESLGGGYENGYVKNQRTWTSAGELSRNTVDNPFRLK